MRFIIIDISLAPDEVDCVEDLILVKEQLRVIDTGFQELGLVTPEWVSEKQLTVTTEITSRVRAELLRRLKTSKARRSALATADEKRSLLDTEIEELEKKLS